MALSNEELVERMERAFARLEARSAAIEARLAAIEAKQGVTNGRLTKLELWRARMEGMGAATLSSWHVVLGLLGGVVGAGSLVVAILALGQG